MIVFFLRSKNDMATADETPVPLFDSQYANVVSVDEDSGSALIALPAWALWTMVGALALLAVALIVSIAVGAHMAQPRTPATQVRRAPAAASVAPTSPSASPERSPKPLPRRPPPPPPRAAISSRFPPTAPGGGRTIPAGSQYAAVPNGPPTPYQSIPRDAAYGDIPPFKRSSPPGYGVLPGE